MNKSAGVLWQGGILGQVGRVLRGRTGEVEEGKRRSAEQSCRAVVSTHMVSQLVGGPVVRSQ